MKCPQCKKNHKHRDGMRCSCGYAFVFDPKVDRMTDGQFTALLKSVSGPEGRFFTENQLFAQYCHAQRKANRGLRVAGLIVAALLGIAAILVGVCLQNEFSVVLGVLAVVLTIIVVLMTKALPDRETFLSGMLGKWRGAGRPIEKLLTKPKMDKAPPEWEEPDIYDYGVERLIVVQHDILADLLVLNGLASEERALVIAESGYPTYLHPIAVKMLKETPELPVFILHDSTPAGVDMGTRLKGSGLLPLAGHPFVDIGLSPETVKMMPRFRAAGSEKAGYQIPVDYLLYPALAKALPMTLQEKAGMGVLLARSKVKGDLDDGFYSGSFG